MNGGMAYLYQIPKKGVTLFARKHHTDSSDGFYETVVLFQSNGYRVSHYNISPP